MKKQTKLFALLLALLMAVSVIAGCAADDNGSSGAPASGENQSKASSSGTAETSSEANTSGTGADGEEKQIVFWTHYTDDIGFTEKKVADYNALMAGKVQVELKHVADDYNNILLMALKNDDAPDIFADGISLQALAEQKFITPLENLASEEMMERAKPFQQTANNYLDGSWYSFPFRGYSFRLAWNKDMFRDAGLDPESPPATYDELLEACEALAAFGAAENKYAFMLPTGEDWIWWIYGMQMGRVNGENYYDFENGRFTWEALKPVMELYVEMKENNYLFPGGTTLQNDPARAQFSAGNVGMIIAASWDIGVFTEQFPAEIEWDVTTLPNTTGDFMGYSQLDCGSYLHINAASDVQQEAMDFYEYLLSEETLIEYYEGGYGVPVYDGISDKAAAPDTAGFEGFADVSLDHVYPAEPPVEIEGKGIGAMMNDIMTGSVSIDEAFDYLNEVYNKALAEHFADGTLDPVDYTIQGFSCLSPLG